MKGSLVLSKSVVNGNVCGKGGEGVLKDICCNFVIMGYIEIIVI